jgi:hypothetical protein
VSSIWFALSLSSKPVHSEGGGGGGGGGGDDENYNYDDDNTTTESDICGGDSDCDNMN